MRKIITIGIVVLALALLILLFHKKIKTLYYHFRGNNKVLLDKKITKKSSPIILGDDAEVKKNSDESYTVKLKSSIKKAPKQVLKKKKSPLTALSQLNKEELRDLNIQEYYIKEGFFLTDSLIQSFMKTAQKRLLNK